MEVTSFYNQMVANLVDGIRTSQKQVLSHQIDNVLYRISVHSYEFSTIE